MWMAKIICPKCLQTHLYGWNGEQKPASGEKYTSYCPAFFIPFYIEGTSFTLRKFKENTIEQVEIPWKEVTLLPAQCLELKKWEPAKIVEID